MGDINQLLQRRHRLMGAGAPLFYDTPVHIVRGEGAWLWDDAGKRYLDVYNNVPCVGHCHPQVVEALQHQSGLLNVHTRYLHEMILDYTERLTGLHEDPLSAAVIVCSGTEANELALRMARLYTGGEGIICSNATYHGNSEAVDELATIFHNGKSPASRVKPVPFPDSYRPITGSEEVLLAQVYADEVKKAIDEFANEGIKLAGIIFCPIFSGEGLPDVPHGYMEAAVNYVRDAGGVYIADEVQAGFARTGKTMWGYQHYETVPDIVTMGKPMGNGHPLAGVVTTTEILNHFRDEVMYFNTFGGNPVQCAVGMAVLDVIEQEKLQENARDTGQYVTDALCELQKRHEIIGDVRGQGLFIGAELVRDRGTKEPATDETRAVINSMKDNGVLLGKIGVHDNVLKMRPPLCFSREQADMLISVLDNTLAGL